jgi:Tol biopolymer transport system component
MKGLFLKRLLPVGAWMVVLLAMPDGAEAAFPGANGKLAFTGIEPSCTSSCEVSVYTIDPDGSGRTALPTGTGVEAGPAWSPDGSKVAFAGKRGGDWDIYTIFATSTAVEQQRTSDPAADFDPAWTPDGQRIVFTSNRDGRNHLWMMNADGSGQTQLTSGAAADFEPAVSPDGTKIAFTSTRDDPNPACTLNCTYDIYVMDIDGSDITRVPIPGETDDCWIGESWSGPNWSPSGDRIAFEWNAQVDCSQELDNIPGRIETVRPDGSGKVQLQYGEFEQLLWPAWSPDGMRIAFGGNPLEIRTMDSDDGGNLQVVDSNAQEPDWQPLAVGYPRPQGASPVRVPLVPAYQQCTASNRTHGPPLAFPSCAPPATIGIRLTIGSGDGSPALARSIGWLRFQAVTGAPGPPNDSDVNVRAQITNVMNQSDLSDYTGQLRARVALRLTDRDNQPAPPTPATWRGATVTDTTIGFTLSCAVTSSTIDGGTCSAITTLNAVLPGSVKDGLRAVWELGQVQVFDAGADGNPSTEGDNQLFETQGVFVP